MLKTLVNSVLMLVVLTLLTGVVYPLVITGLAQVFWPDKANGSLIVKDGKPLGSSLIGQPFDDPKYFWSRPSATTVTGKSDAQPYNAESSGASNLGPTNPDLEKAVKDRIKTLRDADPGNKEPVPVDLVTSSGSGLDPDISPAAAKYQIPRVARIRHLDPDAVEKLVERHTSHRTLGLLGESRVNVLELNLDLDGQLPK